MLHNLEFNKDLVSCRTSHCVKLSVRLIAEPHPDVYVHLCVLSMLMFHEVPETFCCTRALHFPHIQLCPIGEEWWLQKNSLQQWKWKYVFKNIVNILSKYLFIHAAVTNLCTGFPALLEDGKGSELNQAVFSAPPLSVILLLSPSSF